MSARRNMTIAVWRESQGPVIPERPVHRRFLPPGAIGLAGTLLLHALALQSVLLGGRTHRSHPPDIVALGSTLNKSETAPAETWLIVELSKVGNTNNEAASESVSVRTAIKEIPVPRIRPDPLPPIDLKTLALEEEKEPATSVDGAGDGELARWFGIYSGQIQARIERAWRRPRTPVNEESGPENLASSLEYFRCQVQIVQDENGNVQEILLPNCNGSIAWQRSLVSAIRQASPLPAPPNIKVFSRTVSLNFVGYGYAAGASEDGYEILPVGAGSRTVTR